MEERPDWWDVSLDLIWFPAPRRLTRNTQSRAKTARPSELRQQRSRAATRWLHLLIFNLDTQYRQQSWSQSQENKEHASERVDPQQSGIKTGLIYWQNRFCSVGAERNLQNVAVLASEKAKSNTFRVRINAKCTLTHAKEHPPLSFASSPAALTSRRLCGTWMTENVHRQSRDPDPGRTPTVNTRECTGRPLPSARINWCPWLASCLSLSLTFSTSLFSPSYIFTKTGDFKHPHPTILDKSLKTQV